MGLFTPHGLLVRGESFSSGIEPCNTTCRSQLEFVWFVNAMIVGDTQRIKHVSAYSNVWELHRVSHLRFPYKRHIFFIQDRFL